MNPEMRKQFANKFIVVERDRFKLTLYRRKPDEVEAEVKGKWRVAIGSRFYGTPKMFSIIDTMDDSPTWTMPDSKWVTDAGLIPGTVLADDDPDNPIKARWIGISNPGNGIGIHGTAAIESIGTKASHGCIRMIPDDVIELYSMVDLGDPVYID